MAYVKNASVIRDIAADPTTVWSAISDVTRMGEWSPECHTCEWQDGHDGPAVGARFDGHNRNPDNGKEWTTHAEVSRSEPGVSFQFKALYGERDYHFANWGFDLETIDGGTRVTQVWEDLRPDEIIAASVGISGVEDRFTHNTAGMAATLERIAAALEG